MEQQCEAGVGMEQQFEAGVRKEHQWRRGSRNKSDSEEVCFTWKYFGMKEEIFGTPEFQEPLSFVYKKNENFSRKTLVSFSWVDMLVYV